MDKDGNSFKVLVSFANTTLHSNSSDMFLEIWCWWFNVPNAFWHWRSSFAHHQLEIVTTGLNQQETNSNAFLTCCWSPFRTCKSLCVSGVYVFGFYPFSFVNFAIPWHLYIYMFCQHGPNSNWYLGMTYISKIWCIVHGKHITLLGLLVWVGIQSGEIFNMGHSNSLVGWKECGSKTTLSLSPHLPWELWPTPWIDITIKLHQNKL